MTKASIMNRLDNYYRALGKFINEFAKAEEMLLVVVGRSINLQHRESAALLSGMRLRAGVDWIRRLHEAKDASVPLALAEAFEQLAAINTMRDRLVHWGVEPDGEQFVASNRVRAHADRVRRDIRVSSSAIVNMTRDIQDIQKTFMLFILNTQGSDDPIRDIRDGARHQCEGRDRPWRFRAQL